MRELLLLRHAKSSREDTRLDDHDRPLNARGLEDAPRMGALLAHEKLVPQWIACSTALRAATTAQLVADTCGFRGPLHRSRRLYTGGPPEYLEELRGAPDGARLVLVVGHNPVLEDLYLELTGEEETLPTAALAHLALPIESWSEARPGLEAQPLHLWRPKELPD